MGYARSGLLLSTAETLSACFAERFQISAALLQLLQLHHVEKSLSRSPCPAVATPITDCAFVRAAESRTRGAEIMRDRAGPFLEVPDR